MDTTLHKIHELRKKSDYRKIVAFLFCKKGDENLIEIWKDVTGYEGLYQVSNTGKVKTLQKQVGRKEAEKIMKPSVIWTGYLRIGLRKNGKSKNTYIHRIVAQEFIENPEHKPIINHKNGNRQDNRVENLEWCTFGENSKASKKVVSTKRYNSVSVTDNYGNKFNSYREAARFWKLNNNTVKNDVLGRTNFNNIRRKVIFKKGE